MNLGIIIILMAAALWCLSIFFGAMGGLSKTFTNAPAIDSSSVKSQEQQIIQQTAEEQKMSAEATRQRMQDMQRKN